MARWMFSDAIQKTGCQRCGAEAGEQCRSPSGRKYETPHSERLWQLSQLSDFDLNDYKVGMFGP